MDQAEHSWRFLLHGVVIFTRLLRQHGNVGRERFEVLVIAVPWFEVLRSESRHRLVTAARCLQLLAPPFDTPASHVLHILANSLKNGAFPSGIFFLQ